MDDYLGNLLARQFDRLESVEPLLASRFEPPAMALPSGTRGFIGVEDGFAPETRSGFEHESAKASAASLDASSHMPPSRPPRPAAPPRHDLQPSEHHAPKPRTPSTFEPPSPETPTAASGTPRASHEPFELPAHAGRLTHDDTAGPETLKPPRPAPRASTQSERGANPSEVGDAPPAGHSQPRREKVEARAASTSAPLLTPQRETLLVSVRDAFEGARRAGPPPPRAAPEGVPARGADERTPPHDAPRSSARATEDAHARADESERKGAEVETARARVSQERPEDERPTARREPPPTVFVQPRVTQRAEPRVPAQADIHPTPAPEPTINVTIGRIEIRATKATPAPARREEATGAQAMSLEDYLRRRGGGGGR